jgi:hypothetical protein
VALNIRFGQPGRAANLQHTEHEFPGGEAPFTWAPTPIRWLIYAAAFCSAARMNISVRKSYRQSAISSIGNRRCRTTRPIVTDPPT